eukprot:scaffold5850_cov53-Attheya_sp.AAC.5
MHGLHHVVTNLPVEACDHENTGNLKVLLNALRSSQSSYIINASFERSKHRYKQGYKLSVGNESILAARWQQESNFELGQCAVHVVRDNIVKAKTLPAIALYKVAQLNARNWCVKCRLVGLGITVYLFCRKE